MADTFKYRYFTYWKHRFFAYKQASSFLFICKVNSIKKLIEKMRKDPELIWVIVWGVCIGVVLLYWHVFAV